MADVTILIPAAGKSSRMGGADKLLETVRGRPLLRDRVEMALSVCPRVIVTLPSDGFARSDALRGLPLAVIEVPDAAEGMAASLRRGALAAGQSGLMILLGDMPDITTEDLRRLLDAFSAADGQSIVRAVAEDGRAGHPVLFPADCLPAFAQLTGDQGARDILRANASRIVHLPLPADHALTDLDTPEAWAAWRART